MSKYFTEISTECTSLVELLRWRAHHQPDKQAYTFLRDGETEEVSLTYGELDRLARAIGALLQKRGTIGERALLLYPPGLEYITAFFGCLYAGVVAVPAYPPQWNRPMTRLQAILTSAQATLALTTPQILANATQRLAQIPEFAALQWLTTQDIVSDQAHAWQEPTVTSETLAFLQYTSGSTAAPRGVMLTHRNLLHNSALIHRYFEHTATSQGVVWLPPYHDMGLIGGILQPLYGGFPVTLLSPADFLQRPIRWLQAISRYQGTTSGGPNFAYELCARKITPEQRATLDLSCWKVAFSGAEPIRADTLERFTTAFAPCGFRREAFYPCYGLAEATLIVSGGLRTDLPVVRTFEKAALAHDRVVADLAEPENTHTLVSCGHTLSDQQIAIVDPTTLERCQPDQVGEIWVSGASVAQGYWNQPAETAKIFQATCADTGEGPFLRTGDFGFLHYGELFVTGRLKDLIIIRGRNHYPQDIELTVEQSHSALRPGCGAAFSVEVDDSEQLVIVYELERQYRYIDVEEVAGAIRQAVAEQHELHTYAVLLLKTGSIPKTSSGKIQRHTCKVQFLAGTLSLVGRSTLEDPYVGEDEEAPRRETLLAAAPEERRRILVSYLQGQAAQVLKAARHRLDPQQPLSMLGLDSLMALELKNCIETSLGVQLPIVNFLQGDSIDQLSAEVMTLLTTSSSSSLVPMIRGQATDTTVPLTPGQQALWVLYQLALESAAYTMAHAVSLRGDVNIPALRRSFQALVDRHPTLRTTFAILDGKPVQRAHQHSEIFFQEEDASDWGEERLNETVAEHAQRPFDLERGPVLRIHLFRRSACEHLLLFMIHHIVADLWSLTVLMQELDTLYTAEKADVAISLPPLGLQYSDYVRWQADMLTGAEGEHLWKFWQKQLAGDLPALNLPTDRPGPAIQTYHGDSQAFKLDAELTLQIRALARSEGVTLYTALLAAFQVLLHRYTGQEDILVGSPAAGRDRSEVAELVGYFVNPVVLRAEVSGDLPFRAFLQQVRQGVLAAIAHQDYPFALLVERLQPVRDPGRTPLIQVMFALQKAHRLESLSAFVLDETTARMELGGLETASWPLKRQTAQFAVTLEMVEGERELRGRFEYNTDLFDATTITRIIGHWQTLLQGIVASPEQRVADLPLLTTAERQQVLGKWNAATVEYPQNMCLHELFEAQAARTPEIKAVICKGQELTYAELNWRANQLAHYLHRLGVGPEARVGVYMERSVEMIVGLLGILKAGAAYVPLDPSYPAERLAFMLQDARASVLLTQRAVSNQQSAVDQQLPALTTEGLLADQLANGSVQALYLDTDWPRIAQEPGEKPQITVRPANAAYVIYTSGSTGTPKGVCCIHTGVINLLTDFAQRQPLAAGEGCSLWTSLSFDVSVYEIFSALIAGGTLYIAPDDVRADSRQFIEWLSTHQISSAYIPPFMLADLAERVQTAATSLSLRRLLVGVEPIYEPLLATIDARIPDLHIINGYGPTEASICATLYSIQPAYVRNRNAPIGRPVVNVQIYVLNDHMQPVPIGIVGEIYIGGAGVVRGYLDRPDLTAERFVPDSFGMQPGMRLYRTGDLARYLSDGNIEFLGRQDYQVKIRGFRVELGEIEVTLAQYPGVHESVVLAREDGSWSVDHEGQTTQRRDKRLVAYVVPGVGQTFTSADLRRYLQEHLPDFMVPASFVLLETFPLTPNGKLDRRALPAAESVQADVMEAYVAPRNPLEELLASSWNVVLGIERVSIHANFFELGGHSLLATQLISRVRDTFAVDLPLRALFEAPTVAGLAAWIETASQVGPAMAASSIERVTRENVLPLSFAQQRLWLLDQLQPGTGAYTIPAAVRLQGYLDVVALARSLHEIVQRHEILRTTFPLVDGRPQQVISAVAPQIMTIDDLTSLPPGECEIQSVRTLAEEVERPFDLACGPLMRAKLLRLGEEEHILLLTLHHIVADGWSMGVLVRELTALYQAFSTRQPSPLAELPIQYADYAVWQREWLTDERLEQQVSYWREQLAGAPAVLELPTDRPRPPVQTSNGITHSFVVFKPLAEALSRLSQQEGVTLFMTLLAAFQVLLHRYTGQEDLVVGSPIAGRTRAEMEELIGFFVNTLVLRTDLSGNPTFHELLGRVREVCLGAYAYQNVPFEKIVEVLQPERDLSHSPLIQVVFAWQNAPMPPLMLPGLDLHPLTIESGTAKFDLTLTMEENEQGLIGIVEYNSDLFEAATISRMVGHYQMLLEGIVARPEQCLADLPLLTVEECQQMLVTWNATRTAYPRDACIHHLFEAQVEQTPEAIALTFDEMRLTYSELNVRANRLAHYLQTLGVGPEVVVGICMERSLELVVALLAILKAGGVYVPLDTTYPPERLAFLLEDTQARVLLTQEALSPQLAVVVGSIEALPVQLAPILLITDTLATGSLPIENPVSGAVAENLAYVMYTSGSTGRPKGVSVTHRNVVRLVRETNYAILTAEEIFLQFAPVSFDASTLEIWGCLLNGAQLVIFPAFTPSLEELGQVLEHRRITTLWLTAPLFHQMVESQLTSLQQVHQLLAGGDVLSVPHVQKLLQAGGAVINGYGPTENTTFTCCYPMTDPDQVRASVPIGRPIANTQIYVLDPYLQPVPVGVPGELYIGGDGLARGYLKRPELTAERFVPCPLGDPFNTEPGARLYRTGDRVRYLPDGTIEFLGRLDTQVKLRGYRIEPGEIEAVLNQHPEVREAVVVAREDRLHAAQNGSGGIPPSDKRLVAYVIAQPEKAPSSAELRRHLQATLPDYMTPSAFVLLETLPLTSSGKVDRRALPAPQWAGDKMITYMAPRTPIEEVLVNAWAEVLDIDPSLLNVQANFFDLGGHSLLATRAIARLREIFAVELPLRALFEAPTIAGLAERIEDACRDEQSVRALPIERVSRDGVLALSFAQQRLWFLDQLLPEGTIYTIPAAMRLRGHLDIGALERSLHEIIQRHEVLRTSFALAGEQPVQVIAAEATEIMTVVDLTGLPPIEREAQLTQLIAKELARPFDLEHGPLLRVMVAQVGVEQEGEQALRADDEYMLLLTLHHIIADGWSIGVLLRELAALYQANTAGQAVSLPELPIQYADYAAWQRDWLIGERLERQLSYWREQLAGTPTALELPTDHPRPPAQTFHGALHSFTLSNSLTRALTTLSQQEEVTLFMILLATFQVLLHRHSGQEDIVVGTPIANRTHVQTEGLIGFFVNTLALRSDLSNNPSFRQVLERIREVCLGAYMHQDVPFEKLVEELRPERDLSRSPLFQVMFELQNTSPTLLGLPGLRLEPVVVDNGTAKFDLTLLLEERNHKLIGMVEYNTDLFEAASIGRLIGHYQTLLEGVIALPEARIAELPMLTEDERRQVLGEWNATQTAYPFAQSLHGLFEAQVALTPEAIAVIFEDQHLTYAGLNLRANQLAHYLHDLGVGPEILVGVFLERSLELVIALLGILKAGGAFVPLDPGYPKDRLAFMINDGNMSVVIAQKCLLNSLPVHQARVVNLDTEWERIAQEVTENPNIELHGDNLAYMIYTSGSTGTPKGAMNTHHGICNRLLWMRDAYHLDASDRVLQKTPYSFDVSVWEFFWPLITGSGLVVARPEGHRDSAYLVNLIQEHQVTTLHFVPSMLSIFLEAYGLEACKSIQRVFCSGEALPFEVQERFFGRLRAKLYNLYGPTEASIEVTAWTCQRESQQRSVPIGRPIANISIYLLDVHLEPVPIGVPGELHIGGVGLARGYHQRPDLTAGSFIPDLWGKEPGARLYKTGDLARYLADGTIEFLGRLDTQVKLRGYRIELGEIETVLSQHLAVREAIVAVQEEMSGDKRLVAYLVPEPGETVATDELHRYLQATLPNYMVPAAFVLLETLPLTPSGKVDRRALPTFQWAENEKMNSFLSPRTPTEEMLVSVWAEVLGIGQAHISVQANFFDLGGHSLLATRAIARLREIFAVELPLRALFEAPTIAGLAERIEDACRDEQSVRALPIERVSRDGVLALSFAQQRLWFLDQLLPGTSTYTIPAAVRLQGHLDVVALECSLHDLVQRHEALHTTFALVDGRPLQVIAAAATRIMTIDDFTSMPLGEREAHASWTIAEEIERPFDLACGPLVRAKLLLLGNEEFILILTLHHIVADGWSIGVLVRELAALYQAYITGQAVSLPELPIQYADYAFWQREWLTGERLERQVSYWREQLVGAPASLDLLTDHPRPPVRTSNGALYSFVLSKPLAEALATLSQQENVTLFMTLLAAFQVLLYRYSGQEDIVVGTPIANRIQPATEGLIGFFVNTLALRTDLSGTPSFRELLGRVREICLGAYMHQDVPFEKLVEELRPTRDLSRSPLFQVMVALQNAPMTVPALPDLELHPLTLNTRTSKFDLMLLLTDSENGLLAMLEYNTDLFEAATITRMAQHYQTLLEGILANPEMSVSHLPLLTPAERQQILVEWNTVATNVSPQVCLHHLVEAQVARTPEAIAVVCTASEASREGKTTTLTYAELNRQANQVAQHLRRLGVGPDHIVGICAERSLELVIGLLGILKAGAAYMPLDPTYPPHRLAYMLQDAQVRLVLAQERFCAALPTEMVVALDGKAWAAECTERPVVDVTPQHLAYVIYTSGSTGQPKGTLIEHQAISNNLLWMQHDWPLDSTDRLLQKTPFTFDVSVKEVFWPLIAGAQVVLAQPGGQRDPEYLRTLIRQAGITVTHFVPSMLQAFLAGQAEPAVGSLRLVMCGAEALSVSLQERFFQLLSAQLLHLYGPTETAIAVTGWVCERGSQRERVPLGRPIPHVQLYVLDAVLQPVPIGVPGELYIGGIALGRGYLNRPEETAAKFIPDPFGGQVGGRLYKTGDVARYREDGNLEYLGRLDQQVKLRGLRVELGEIETVLRQHPGVQEAVVQVWEVQPGEAGTSQGDKRLVGYVVPNAEQAPTPRELSQYLQERLPDYMVPTTFLLLEVLPVNANGKLDRWALPAPGEERPELTNDFVAPRTPIEESIATIWRDTLSLEQVGVYDNFFELGGHSLLAVQVVSRLRDIFHIELPLRALFEAPTITGISSAIEQAGRACSVIQRPAVRPVSRDLYRQKIHR